MTKWLSCIAVAMAVLLGPGGAFAQTYPDKPVRVVIPYAPGGATDNIARVVFQGVQKVRWRQVAKQSKIELE